MSAFVAKFLQTFFQQIPNCVCLVFAIGSLAALGAMLLKRRHHGLYALLWGAFLFMGLWRCFKGIVSIRYASIMIYPMVIATAFFCCRADALWRLLCRRFPRLPGWFGRVIALGFLFGCAGGALLIAHYKLNVQSRVFTTIYKTVSQYRELCPGLRVLVKHDNAARITYLTKVPCIPLPDNRREFFVQGLNNIIEPNGHLLLVAEERKLDVFEPLKGELRPGATLSRIRSKRYRKSKRKDLDIYFYQNPLVFSRIAGVPPTPASAPGCLLGPGAFGPARFAGVLRSRPVREGGRFRFTFVLTANGVSGSGAALEVRTDWRQGNKEIRTPQLRCRIPSDGIYRGVAAFNVSAVPFAVCLSARGATVRLEQFHLTRAE